MFKAGITLDILNNMSKGTMAEHLGIEFIEIGTDYIMAKMPVDFRTVQPFKLLHGGASVALAETLGSVAANISLKQDDGYCVGLEINANHIKSVTGGIVYGKTTPVHIGKKTQVWDIRISNENQELVCISRITLAVMTRNN